MKRLIIAVLVLAAGIAQAATTFSLQKPADPFALLGYSCGGIKVALYATGFDVATGGVAGVVFESTTCGNRVSHTYTSIHSTLWDLRGNLLKLTSYDGTPYSATFSVKDASGHVTYNQAGLAYVTDVTAPPAPAAYNVSVVDLTFMIASTGGQTLQIKSVTFGDLPYTTGPVNSGRVALVNTTCGQSLPVGTSCSYSFSYNSNGLESDTGYLTEYIDLVLSTNALSDPLYGINFTVYLP